jgi:hypothetical protein
LAHDECDEYTDIREQTKNRLETGITARKLEIEGHEGDGDEFTDDEAMWGVS